MKTGKGRGNGQSKLASDRKHIGLSAIMPKTFRDIIGAPEGDHVCLTANE